MPYGVYRNGNATVKINLNDGTRIITSRDDEFDFDFPLSIDLNIGNRCDGGCKFCYINASPRGKDGELLKNEFLETINPYTEVAINGNSVDHPQLVPFLEKMKRKNVICNITVNQVHFELKERLIKLLVDRGLVKGIGISLRKPTSEFIAKVKKYPNAVIHCINGILSEEDINAMADNDLKLLILGYKDLGRGVDYKKENESVIEANQKYMYDNLQQIVDRFHLVSFDNLALEQLDVKRILTDEQWEEFYQGDEGTCSMFIDLVTNKFGVSSLCSEDEMHPIMDDIKKMFHVVKTESKLKKGN